MSLKFILLAFVLSFLLFSGAINIYQPSTLNSDGSGSFKLSYFTSDSNLVNTKVLGNYAFTEAEARANFTSANTNVKSVQIYNDSVKTVTHVVLEIDFKDINKISEAKGFLGIKASWTKKDSGMDFQWVIGKSELNNNVIGNLIYIFKFDGEILSSNGAIEGDTVTWFMTPTTADYTNDITLTAVVETKKNSSCGPFGIELPLVLLCGMVLLVNIKRKKK